MSSQTKKTSFPTEANFQHAIFCTIFLRLLALVAAETVGSGNNNYTVFYGRSFHSSGSKRPVTVFVQSRHVCFGLLRVAGLADITT